MMDIRWIFFDIGSTLVDETQAYDRRARKMLENTEITFRGFDSKRIEFAKQGFDGDTEAIKYFGLRKTPWPSEDEVVYDDARETLETLKNRGYRLGIIANQPAGTAQRLQERGLSEFFDTVIASAEAGVAKPDSRIFEMALNAAECAPSNAVMVGDRLDNDILPAKKLGMKTVWIRKGMSRHQDISLGKGIADRTICALAELNEIFTEAPFMI